MYEPYVTRAEMESLRIEFMSKLAVLKHELISDLITAALVIANVILFAVIIIF
ncbi:hypothetical protein [Pseudomonas sp. FYR_11]|uniref:hypothetical protein n=1 Tax=Pseudomonas TaxID=286 RepID=UPI00370A1935